jgi:hypothetical protein
MVGKETALGHFRHVFKSSGENCWSQYCPAWSRLKWDVLQNSRVALQVIHLRSVAAAFRFDIYCTETVEEG